MLKNKALFLGLMAVLVTGFALGGEVIPNWSAPATWHPTSSGGAHTMADITNAMPFIAVTPCRIADTRGNGFTGAYGPPALIANANRDFVITGQCSIPTAARAVSFNFGALDVGAAGDLRVFPAGGGLPLVSTMNYNANTPNIANAAVVTLGTGGAITVRADAVSVNLIIDVNGYYADTNSAILLNPGIHFEIAGNVSPPFATLDARNNSTAAGAMALLGIAGGLAGVNYGIMGRQDGIVSFSAGVLGQDGRGVAGPTGGPSFSAGVVGNAGNGVIGRSSASDGDGVAGIAEDSTGTITGWGIVGNLTHAFRSIIGDTVAPSPSITVDPHPTDASVVIGYTALTGNEAGTYFRGTATTEGREFVIDVPEDFRMVTDPEGLTVQLTPVGAAATMYVVSEDANQIVVRASRDVKFHYLVQGVRQGYKNYNPMKTAMGNSTFLPQTADGMMQSAWPEWVKQRLIANGTYNADGTINMQTAERLGWAQAWRQEAEAAKAAAAKMAAARAEMK